MLVSELNYLNDGVRGSILYCEMWRKANVSRPARRPDASQWKTLRIHDDQSFYISQKYSVW